MSPKTEWPNRMAIQGLCVSKTGIRNSLRLEKINWGENAWCVHSAINLVIAAMHLGPAFSDHFIRRATVYDLNITKCVQSTL